MNDDDDLMKSVMEIVTNAEARNPDSLPITRKRIDPWDRDVCHHQRVEVDDILREVSCRDCDVRLDPINVILNVHTYMRGLQRYVERINDYERREAARKAREKARRERKQQTG
jgi:hypothetical protein